MYDYLLGGKDNYAADRAADRGGAQGLPGAGLHRAGEPGVPRPRRPLPRRRGGDPAVPRHRHRHPDGGQHPPGRPGDRAGVPGRVRGLRPGRARPRPRAADQQRGGRHRVHRRRPARHRHDPRPGRPAARLHPAGGGHAGRDPARDTGRRRPARDRGPADGRRAVRQLPRALPPGVGPPRRRRRCGNAGPLDAARSSSSSRTAAASRWRASSPALDLVEPGLVPVEEWRPEPGTADAGKSALWCAVGRKR